MRICALGAALALLTALPAAAGALRVGPVGLELPSGQNAAVLTLSNDDALPMKVQVRVFRWTQAGGQESLEPATDVVASPPIGGLDARSEQLIRIVHLGPAVPSEASYRLIIDELPPPPSSDLRQVRLLMRHSIPLFLEAATHTPANVSWRTSQTPAGPVVTAVNQGGRRLRISNLKLLDGTGALVAERNGLIGYVLAGSEMSWEIPLSAPNKGLPRSLRADTDAGRLEVSLKQND